MTDAMDMPDPEGIADILTVEVAPLRLERDEQLRQQVEVLTAGRTRRRLAEAVCQYLAFPREVIYEETMGAIRPREAGSVIELQFLFTAGKGEDRYRFVLIPEEGGLKYSTESIWKRTEEPWGGGTLPGEVKERLLPAIRKHPVIWGLSERIVRVVEPAEINWEWQPLWNLHNVTIPNRRGSLADVVAASGSPPKYVILATWELALEEHEWGASGWRVQMFIDPRQEAVAQAWEDEWYALY